MYVFRDSIFESCRLFLLTRCQKAHVPRCPRSNGRLNSVAICRLLVLQLQIATLFTHPPRPPRPCHMNEFAAPCRIYPESSGCVLAPPHFARLGGHIAPVLAEMRVNSPKLRTDCLNNADREQDRSRPQSGRLAAASERSERVISSGEIALRNKTCTILGLDPETADLRLHMILTTSSRSQLRTSSAHHPLTRLECVHEAHANLICRGR